MENAWKKNYLSAIVRVVDLARLPERSVSTVTFKKYRNIPKAKRDQFESFIREKFPNAAHVNYYERFDRSFVERVYF